MRADENNGRSKMNDRMNEKEREGKESKITHGESTKNNPFHHNPWFQICFCEVGEKMP